LAKNLKLLAYIFLVGENITLAIPAAWINSNNQWCNQSKLILGGKFFDFRLATVFYLGYRLSKHKMTRHSKHFRGNGPLGSSRATPMATTS